MRRDQLRHRHTSAGWGSGAWRLLAVGILGMLVAGCTGISSDVYRRGAIQAAYGPRARPRAASPGRSLALVVPPFGDLRSSQHEEQTLWLCALPIGSCWAYWYRPDWLLWRDSVYAAYKPAAQDLAEVFAAEIQRSELFRAVKVDKAPTDADLALEGKIRELTLNWRPHFLGASYPVGQVLGYLGLPMGDWRIRQTLDLRLVQTRDQTVLWSKEFSTRAAGAIAVFYGGDPILRGYPAESLLAPVLDEALTEIERVLTSKGEGYWVALSLAKPGSLGAKPGSEAPKPEPAKPANRPPRIVFLQPKGDLSTQDDRTELVIRVEDPDSKLAEVSVQLAAGTRALAVVPVESTPGAAEPGMEGDVRIVKRSIDLAEGANLVKATAADDQGLTATQSIAITRTPRGPAPASGQRFAVVIGISEYKDSRIPGLRYAAADAKGFNDWLVDPQGGGYAPNRVKLLLDKDATAARIREALFTWGKEPLAEDFLLIYFAGHGSPESPETSENLFLLPHDAEYDKIASTGFPMWDIETALRRFIKAKKVVVIADACHAGGVGSPFLREARDPVRNLEVVSGRLTEGLQALSKVSDGVAVLTASGAKQLSREGQEWGGGHGVFTYYLLKGLRGDADYTKDGKVTLGELISYVSEHVRRETKNAQSPEVAGKYDPALTLGK